MDDFLIYGAVPVEVTYTGCGGEFCPGRNPGGWTDLQWFGGDGTPFLCPACKAGVTTTGTEYRPDNAPRGN